MSDLQVLLDCVYHSKPLPGELRPTEVTVCRSRKVLLVEKVEVTDEALWLERENVLHTLHDS